MKNEASAELKQASETIARLEKELRLAYDELERTSSELVQLTLELEDRVDERTAELKKSKEELARHRDHLQELVDERTIELKNVNEELKEKLEALQASEERFRSLVVTIPDIVYRIDEEGHFTFVNSAIRRLGYEPYELIGQHFSEIIMPADVEEISREKVLKKYWGKKNGKDKSPKLFDERRTGDRRTTGLEVRLITKSRKINQGVIQNIGDEVLVVEVNSAGMYGLSQNEKDKVFIGTVGVIRDISDRKRAEADLLRQSNTISAINTIFQATLIQTTQEKIAQVALDLLQELTESKMGFIGELNEKGRFDCTAISQTGWEACRMPVEQVKPLLKDLELKGVRAKAVNQGVTQIINDPAHHPDWTGIPEGHPPITSFLGVPVKHGDRMFGLIGLANKKGGYDQTDADTAECLAVALVEALMNIRQEAELREYRNHLESLVEKRTFEIKSMNEALVSEIGERKQAQNRLQQLLEELQKSQAQLIETEKIAALGTMTAGVAHELNNPMMGMLNFIQYCLKHTDKDDRRQPVLQDAERETRRCIDIVRNLLTFSRMEKDGAEDYSYEAMQEIIDRVLRLLAYRLEKENVEISMNIDPDALEIPVKISNIQQVLLNLIANALDALKESHRKQLHIHIRPCGEMMEIMIKDTGCGIKPENFPKIFDPFFTTKPPGLGTGLGLSVCQGIVSSHGGKITCSSSLGNGTEFTVILPLKRPDAGH